MTKRKKNGRYLPGNSGNPRGRPTSESAAIRKQLMINHEEIIQVIRNAALGGDMQACKMVLDRICPPMKAQAAPVMIKLPEGDFTQIAEALIRAAAEGSLPPDVAAQMVAAVGQLARITEIKEDLPKPEDDTIIDRIIIQSINCNGEVKDLTPVTEL